MYEVTETRVAVITEPDGSYEELLEAVQALVPTHAHVRIVHWYPVNPPKDTP